MERQNAVHQSQLNRIRDPLTESFTLSELPKIAPWVAEQIEAEGVDHVAKILAEMGEPQPAHAMVSWVTAVRRASGGLREALSA